MVERLFAWLGRNRPLAKDFEAIIASAAAFLYAASVMLLTRRFGKLARVSEPQDWIGSAISYAHHVISQELLLVLHLFEERLHDLSGIDHSDRT